MTRVLEERLENLARTYIALGRHAPGSRLVYEDSFVACTGDVEHPISNFAVRLRLDGHAAERLRGLAAGRSVFNVYLDGDDSGQAAELKAAGFRRIYTLLHMQSSGEPRPAHPEARQALGPRVRQAIAGFMTEQFFGSSSEGVKVPLTAAIAAAVRLQLYGVFKDEELLAAMMLHRSAGCIGLYNLCVLPAARGRGYGSALVEFALARGGDLQVPVTLQCDKALESFYERLGFCRRGTVEVFALSKRANEAIMK